MTSVVALAYNGGSEGFAHSEVQGQSPWSCGHVNRGSTFNAKISMILPMNKLGSQVLLRFVGCVTVQATLLFCLTFITAYLVSSQVWTIPR